MIKVELISHTNVDPIELAQFGGNLCYDGVIPIFGASKLNVEKGLFEKGHHTTLQHWSATFVVEGIAVSDITFGFHLANPFYNTGQRSGRYCSDMFKKPDYVEAIRDYVKKFWPQVSEDETVEIVDYVKFGVDVYNVNFSRAEKIALSFLCDERPYAPFEVSAEQKKRGLKGHVDNASKIAQEQLRVLMSTIFPTAFIHTITLTALAASHESASTPATKYVTGEMARLIIEKFPKLAFMFKEEKRRKDEFNIQKPDIVILNTKNKPGFNLIGVTGEELFVNPEAETKHPLDKLHFLPETMDNSVGGIETEVELSVATMGQDQRHRTIGRGLPQFTGSFYIPPIMVEMGLEKEGMELMGRWIALWKKLPGTLAMILAPYGAMVKYRKRGSFNAILHEQGKRLCWLAQEEIYHAGRLLRVAIEKEKGSDSELLGIFDPPCYKTGVCGEGNRYCGRDLKVRKTGDYFPERKV